MKSLAIASIEARSCGSRMFSAAAVQSSAFCLYFSRSGIERIPENESIQNKTLRSGNSNKIVRGLSRPRYGKCNVAEWGTGPFPWSLVSF